MEIYEELQATKTRIIAARDAAVEAAKNVAMSEKILPHRAEIDEAFVKARDEIAVKLANDKAAAEAIFVAKIKSLDEKAAADINRLQQLGDAEKGLFEKKILEEELAKVNALYDASIKDLEEVSKKYKRG